MSRNIGFVREEDNKLITQFSQLFIALNEKGEVLACKPTKSTSFSEIEDVLLDVKKILELAESKTGCDCVDECRVRNKYEMNGSCCIMRSHF